jgi:hypothetical protein
MLQLPVVALCAVNGSKHAGPRPPGVRLSSLKIKTGHCGFRTWPRESKHAGTNTAGLAVGGTH